MWKHIESNTIFQDFDQLRLWLVQNKNRAIVLKELPDIMKEYGIEEYIEPPQAPDTYRELRSMGYGSLQDQLDMQYWDAINGTTIWLDHITAVKENFPKPVGQQP